MPLVKKTNPDWKPSENPGLQVGEIIDMTNPEKLVKFGMAVYVDSQGNELKREKTFQCPICTKWFEDPYVLATHILNDHQTAQSKVQEIVTGTTGTVPANIMVQPIAQPVQADMNIPLGPQQPKAFKDMTDEEKKQWRLDNLRKARESKKVQEEAKLTAEAVKASVAVVKS